MKAIIQSYTPQECERIINGRQTIKVCKTAPKDTPFKVYIYCTNPKIMGELIMCKSAENSKLFGQGSVIGINKGFRKAEDKLLSGKVIGEYVCEKMDKYRFSNYEAEYDVTHDEMSQMCLNHPDLIKYGKGKTLRGLHISSPKIYDKPKELVGFKTIKCTNKRGSCSDCKIKPDCIKQITRPPHGWQYVEDLQ